MKEKIIAKRYADAFLSYSKESIGIEKAIEELKEIKIVFSDNPDFAKFLSNLEILFAEKCDFLDKVLKDISPESRGFLKLLLEKGRIRSIIDIADYVRINYSYGEALDALLKTTYPLDIELIKEIKTHLEKLMQRKLNLHIELDGNLLGGVELRVNNTVIDGSVRRRIEDLREKLETVRF